MIVQGGYKEHAQSFKAFRNKISGYGYFGYLWSQWASANDTAINVLVYLHSVLMIMAGALVIANARVGGLLLAISMIIHMLTRDNPMLTFSDLHWKLTFHNLLKDLAVAGAGILIFLKKQTVRHRKHTKAQVKEANL